MLVILQSLFIFINIGQMNNRQMTGLTSDEASEKLELFISCRNLADLDFITVTDSFLIVKLQEVNKPEKIVLKTKVYWNDLNPNYAQTVTIEYFFQIRQKLKFQVFHEANPPKLVGTAESTLGQIFGSPDNGIKKELQDRKGKKSGDIIIRCEKVAATTNSMIEFSLECSDLPSSFTFLCFGSNCDSFYRIFRKRQRDQLLIHESEPVIGTDHPRFNVCKLSERRLCKNNPDGEFEIRLYKYSSNGSHEQMGSAQMTVNKILDGRRAAILDKKNRQRGTIGFRSVKRYVKNTFIDYLAAGLQLMLITCIDFTASNGSAKSPTSLHYILPNKKSPYEEALEEVSRILLDYDYDKLVPVYGFGAKCSMPTFNSFGKTHHCFPLNGNQQNAHVFMVEGIMQAYRSAIQFLEFSGPTLFNVLLSSAIEQCYQIQKQTNQYMIVFILTDGQIHDKQQVIDQLVQCCNLPISIIIVGIGNGPFDVMNEIDDDDCKMVDSRGRKTTRDLVQFVEFRKFRNNGVELARQVLEELPRQVQQYYQIMNIGPDRLEALRAPQVMDPFPRQQEGHGQGIGGNGGNMPPNPYYHRN